MAAAGIPKLVNLVTRFPRVHVLLDHFARPNLADGPPYASASALFGLAAHPGVHLKVTNRTLREASRGASTPEAFFPRIVAAFGANRITWGSNYPAAEGTLAALLSEATSALSVLPEADRAWIFNRTARTVYPVLDARRAAGHR